MATIFEDSDVILEMVESGNLFWEAVIDGDLSKIKLLIESGRYDANEADSSGRSALHAVCCRGMYDAAELLLSLGADVMKKDKHDNTPLHWCGHVEIVELLVENGADLFAKNSIGFTPRQMAERRGVDKFVIDTYRDFEKQRHVSAPPSKRNLRIFPTRNNPLPSLFHEFSQELSKKNMFLLILGLLAFSLYLTYIIMGGPKTLETKIPIYVHPTKS